MIKKLKGIFIISIIIIFTFINLIGCKKIEDTGRKIVPPEVKNNAITGIWNIYKYQIIDERIADKKESDKLINSNVSFGEDVVRIGEIYFTMPKYKLKVVNSKYYFLHEYKADINKYNIEDKEVEAVLISDSGNGFCELVLSNDKEGYLFYNGVIYWVKKVSNESEKADTNKINNDVKEQDKVVDTSYDMPTGLYLGLKTPRTVNEDGTYSNVKYRTLWISFSNGKLNDIHERENILLPRMKGFWEVKVEENKKDGKLYEFPEAKEKKNGENKYNNEFNNKENINHYEEIMFVGNDYIATEYYTGDDFKGKYNSYKMLPVDNLQVSNGIDIGTLLGDNAKKAFKDSYDLSINLLPEEQKVKFNNDNLNYENYTMIRKNGHWILKGKAEGLDNEQRDFNIEYLPPKKLVNYDRLYVTWNTIKDILPSAIDAYTSPNGRIILIANKEYIYIYQILKGKITGEPLSKIKLNKDESIIMAEWANGDFVDRWNKFFINNN
ncbi:hypothetical protein [Clostridium fallax]|uniref:Lipoprotein n=1 Tax=Clostridium fallax TaxID=1533 RepID=A0A1M4WEA2_9CLOT|nr:hypothetical protein [Clostridium fallax]SHE79611.1 hypothetical protein SAMN05443638_1126 [Clostridium fallax]